MHTAQRQCKQKIAYTHFGNLTEQWITGSNSLDSCGLNPCKHSKIFCKI